MNFRYALTLANTLYDVDISEEDDAIEVGLVAYNFIGNKNTVLKKEILKIDCKTGLVELPCGVTYIESVTLWGEDFNYTDNIYNNGDINSLYTENYIEDRKRELDPLYVSGRLVKYRRVGDILYTNRTHGRVLVVYHQEVLDEDNLPDINDKEAIAIAEYIAYTDKWKEALRTNNKNLYEAAERIKQLWLFHADAARSPLYISQNDMDNILDAVSTSNRKLYGKSYKAHL